MSAELAVIEGVGDDAPLVPTMAPNLGGLAMLPQYVEFVRQIAATPFVPVAMRNKPHEILACMLKGYELGLGPMQSLDSIDVIQGTPSLKPEAMRALVNQQGHTIRIVENTNEKCSISVRRKEWPAGESDQFTWTMGDARTAGLASKDIWKKYPRAMLLARVTSEACRAHFSDVIKGLSYTPEEVEEFTPRAALPADPSTGEIAGGGEPTAPSGDPVAPPASVRRPPPRRADAAASTQKEEAPASVPQNVQVPAGGGRSPDAVPPATIPAAALDALRSYAARKGLDDVKLTALAGKPLESLTEAESQALTGLVAKAPKVETPA